MHDLLVEIQYHKRMHDTESIIIAIDSLLSELVGQVDEKGFDIAQEKLNRMITLSKDLKAGYMSIDYLDLIHELNKIERDIRTLMVKAGIMTKFKEDGSSALGRL